MFHVKHSGVSQGIQGGSGAIPAGSARHSRHGRHQPRLFRAGPPRTARSPKPERGRRRIVDRLLAARAGPAPCEAPRSALARGLQAKAVFAGNIIGGVTFVALLNYGQVARELEER
jgi:hypothetical protein